MGLAHTRLQPNFFFAPFRPLKMSVPAGDFDNGAKLFKTYVGALCGSAPKRAIRRTCPRENRRMFD